MKYNYYIAILFKGGRYRFVTSINKSTAHWEDGQPARNFQLNLAKDIVFGLVSNGWPAVIVTAPASFELANPEKEAVENA